MHKLKENIEIDETDYQNIATEKGEDEKKAKTEPDYEDNIEGNLSSSP
ncbi:19618_t:CDS:2 [Gigaspora margarita]|uniref:19618_t:CDS:1 n=1 Tax=Gigaspora margarita TaxID=4874 RepID=A0ABM8W3L5_GIGMA|nr:19618_t:CDS:2 [Gigaspora margarita]